MAKSTASVPASVLAPLSFCYAPPEAKRAKPAFLRVADRRKQLELSGMDSDKAAETAAAESIARMYPGIDAARFLAALQSVAKATPKRAVTTKKGTVVQCWAGVRFPGWGSKPSADALRGAFSDAWSVYGWASALEGSESWSAAVSAALAGKAAPNAETYAVAAE